MALPKSTKIPVKISVPVNSVTLAASLGRVFEDPEVGPADWTPRLSVLSLDIETDPAARRLLAIGLHGCGASEVLLLTPPGRGCPDGARPFPTEKDLLVGFCARVRELDPDVLTGWNVVDFDLFVLDRIAGPNGVPLELGRGPGTLRLRAQGSPRGARQATIPGRVVLDGIHLLRGAFVRMDDYGLDARPSPSIASPPRSPPSTFSTSQRSDGGGSRPRASARKPRSWSLGPKATSSSPFPASTRTPSCWTSRVSTRASSAPSRSTP